MPLENHSLVSEFPEYRDAIHRLKMADSRFSQLFNDYDTVEHAIHRIESGAEAASDAWLESLKKERLQLKDALFKMLKSAA